MCKEVQLDILNVVIDPAHGIANEYVDNSENVKA